MKRLLVISFLVLTLTVSLAVLAGCGGGDEGGGTATLTEPEQLIDNMLHAVVAGNPQPFLDLLPPDMRDAYAGIAEGLFPYQNGQVVELNFRTEEIDPTHVNVYYWGTIQYDDENGQQVTDTINEEDNAYFPLVNEDGTWYLDIPAETSGSPTGQ